MTIIVGTGVSFGHQPAALSRLQGWCQYNENLSGLGETMKCCWWGRRREGPPKTLLLACLHPYSLFPSLLVSLLLLQVGGSKQGQAAAIPLPHQSSEAALQMALVKAALPLTWGPALPNPKAIGVVITPVIAVNKKRLGGHFTKTKKKNQLFVSYMSTLISERRSQISFISCFTRRELNSMNNWYQIFVRKAPMWSFVQGAWLLPGYRSSFNHLSLSRAPSTPKHDPWELPGSWCKGWDRGLGLQGAAHGGTRSFLGLIYFTFSLFFWQWAFIAQLCTPLLCSIQIL